MNRVLTILAFILFYTLPAYAGVEPPELTNVAVGDSNCKIEWKGMAGVSGYNIYLKKEDGDFIPLNSALVRNAYVRITDLVNGMPYRFGVTAVALSEKESPVSVTALVVPLGYSHKILFFKGGSRAADYHLFSVPYKTARRKPEEIFSYFPLYETSLWRFFSFDREGYREYGDIEEIEPGRGYWFLSRNSMELFLSGRTPNVYKPIRLQLHPGWNLIGSPFLFPVEWEEVLTHNRDFTKQIGNTIWEFTGGGFQKSGLLEPFKGYFLFNGFGDSIDILIPPVPSIPKIITEVSAFPASDMSSSNPGGSTGWLLKIEANDGVYSDRDNVIGIDPHAVGEDIAVSAEPPAWPQHLSLYFVREDEPGIRRSNDIRRQKGEWTAFVAGGETDVVTLKWKSLKGRAQTLLVDTRLESEIDMSLTGSYTFVRSHRSPRKFIIRPR